MIQLANRVHMTLSDTSTPWTVSWQASGISFIKFRNALVVMALFFGPFTTSAFAFIDYSDTITCNEYYDPILGSPDVGGHLAVNQYERTDLKFLKYGHPDLINGWLVRKTLADSPEAVCATLPDLIKEKWECAQTQSSGTSTSTSGSVIATSKLTVGSNRYVDQIGPVYVCEVATSTTI